MNCPVCHKWYPDSTPLSQMETHMNETAKEIDEDIGLDFVSKEEVIGQVFDSLESGIGYDDARPMIIIGVMTYIQDVIQ